MYNFFPYNHGITISFGHFSLHLQALFSKIALVVDQLHSFEEFYSLLIGNTSFVNQALFDTHYNSWQALEERVNTLGFKYAEGMNLRSITCYEADLDELECTGGYNIRLNGDDKSEENLNRLRQLLRETDLPIKRVVIPNTDGAIEVII